MNAGEPTDREMLDLERQFAYSRIMPAPEIRTAGEFVYSTNREILFGLDADKKKRQD